MTGPGSAGNVISALCSLFVPGLGQLAQARVLAALVHFLLAGMLWLVTLGTMGWLMHLWSAYSAARFRPRPS